MDEGKKISLPEIIFMLLLVGGVDLFEVVAGLIIAVPIVGQILIFINWFLDIIVLAITQLWFIMKGGIGFKNVVTSLVGNLAEFIPGFDILPIRTITLIIAIYMINHPKVAKVALMASGKLDSIKEDAVVVKKTTDTVVAVK